MPFVSCSFCDTQYLEYQPTCRNCGGPLPVKPGSGPGAQPPPAPRELPPGYMKKKVWLRPTVLVGAIFALVGLPFLVIFPIVGFSTGMWLFIIIGGGLGGLFTFGGATLFFKGYSAAKKRVAAYIHGTATMGTISNVAQNYNVRINGRSPWNVTYQFQAEGGKFQGVASSLDDSAGQREVGQQVHVLYMPRRPRINTIYPPL